MAYQLSTIATKVQTRVRDTAFAIPTIYDFINATQNDVFNEYNLRFMEASQTYTLGVGVQDLTNGAGLPADFQTAVTINITRPGFERTLVYKDYQETDELYPSLSIQVAGTPTIWSMYGSTINVFTKPDIAYTALLRYLKRPTQLSGDSDVPTIPQEFEEILIYGAGMRVFQEKDMDGKASEFQQLYQLAVTKLVNRFGYRQVGQPMKMRLANRPLVNLDDPWG